MNRRLILAVSAFLSTTNGASAQIRPQPGTGDPRLQSIDYRDNQIVQIFGAPGYQISIALAPDEQVQSIALGDSAGWQVSPTHSGDHLILKPLLAGANTNMTVVTDMRTYAFDLVSLEGPASDMPYTISFRYSTPQPASVTVGKANSVGRYRISGDHSLRPAQIYDDEIHTYIDWPANAALPATYSLDERGQETLTSGAMRGGTYVIDSVNTRLVFRVDKQSARADR